MAQPRSLPRWGVVVAVLGIAALWYPYRHFTTDDAFIHYRFAENLAHGRGFAFNPGTPTYGDTAPGWVCLVAGLGRLLEPVAPEYGPYRLASKLLNATGVAFALWCFHRLMRHRVAAAFATLATLLFALDPWLIKWGPAGMETPLAVALVLAAWLARDHYRSSGRLDWVTPALLGVGYWFRPECALLVGVLGTDIAFSETRRRWANLLACALVPTAIALPWLAYAANHFGTIVPNTLGARRDVNFSLRYITWKLAKILLSAYALPIVALAWGALRRRPEVINRENFFPLAAASAVLAFYWLWHVSVGARYVLLVAPLLLVLGYTAIVHLCESRPRLLHAILIAQAAILIGVSFDATRFVTRWPKGLDAELFQIADFLATQTPDSAVVAAHEIGVLGHKGKRPLVDLAGLVSPELTPYARTGSVATSLAGRQVDYLVWNSNVSPDTTLLAELGDYLEPLLVKKVHREGSSHRGGWQYYTVYRVGDAADRR